MRLPFSDGLLDYSQKELVRAFSDGRLSTLGLPRHIPSLRPLLTTVSTKKYAEK